MSILTSAAAPSRNARWDPWAILVWILAGLVMAAFLWCLLDLLERGIGQISWSFITETPENAGRGGGIGPIIVSTLLIIAVCLGTAVPLAIAVAVFLVELLPQHSRLERVVQISLDTLAAVPSVVFGLFGNAFFCIQLGLGFSILSGGLTLACMVLPLLIRTTESSIRAVPQRYRLAAAGLGMTKPRTIRKLVVPLAMPGIVVGTLLALGRAMAETVALVFTSGYVDRMPGSLMDSGRSLSIHVFDLAMNVPGGDANAYGTGVVLIFALLVINGAVLCLAKIWKSKTGLAITAAM
jgi:phosphate transport system permease protein